MGGGVSLAQQHTYSLNFQSSRSKADRYSLGHSVKGGLQFVNTHVHRCFEVDNARDSIGNPVVSDSDSYIRMVHMCSM